MSVNYPYWQTMSSTIPSSTATTPTYTIGSGGPSGGTYTVGSTSTTYTLSSNATTIADWNAGALFSDVDASALRVKGNAKIEGELEVNGKNIVKVLEGIEKRLAILHPNPKLEEKWERLKALGDMYRELEKEIIEKEQIWATLKK